MLLAGLDLSRKKLDVCLLSRGSSTTPSRSRAGLSTSPTPRRSRVSRSGRARPTRSTRRFLRCSAVEQPRLQVADEQRDAPRPRRQGMPRRSRGHWGAERTTARAYQEQRRNKQLRLTT